MNILMVGDTLPEDKPGGGGTYLWEVSQRLASSGHKVSILVQQHHPKAPFYQNKNGIHIYRFKNHRGNLLLSLISRLRTSRQIFEELAQRIDFDLINIHFALGGFSVLRSQKSQPIPCIFTFNGPWAHESLIEDRNLLQNKKGFAKIVCTGRTKFSFWIKSYIERDVIQKASRFLVLSQFSKNILIDTYNVTEEKIVVIPGGVNTMRFNPRKDKDAAKAILEIPSSLPVMLTIRRLTSRMGLENLIRAIPIVLQKHRVILIIGGTGHLKDQLKILVNEHNLEEYIKFVGYIPDDQLSLYYQAADLFILPSLFYEGFGLVTLEALSSGVPVLGNAVGGTIEILEKLDPGLLVFNSKPEALAKAIIATLDRNDLAPDYFRQFARNNYSWDKIFPRIEELFVNITHTI